MNLTIEESNFLRFYFLNLKIASQAVKVYFDSVHPPAGLATELANSEAKLKGLRFITHLQLQILYPSNASNVTSDNFDTTLLICLLRNLPPRQSAPATGWDNLPHPGDTSIGADLARVKWYRNKLVHSNDGILSSTDVIQYWGDLEGMKKIFCVLIVLLSEDNSWLWLWIIIRIPKLKKGDMFLCGESARNNTIF
ncbi:uncharacterized protein LOC127710637 isoform X2 [Mytilus californianus]|uniref:uncharacterized protein LOC127710637 isoform X2 n=1 Tax=Mytilus californianus TaxID=6549 RepID=UPI002246DECD|nr:uncharacterized protein LOC127710637 isoform X2 [Mytilus californianus]